MPRPVPADDWFADQFTPPPPAPAPPAPANPGFDVELALTRVREAVKPYRKAALFELADDGFRTPFEQLAACLISVRTRDEETVPVAKRLFARARTPAEVARLSVDEIDALISGCTFHRTKAENLATIARRCLERHGGQAPCEREALLELPGIGVKCTHLVLGIACGQPQIGVDIHVHRITNRWGYVATPSPERTTVALTAILPRRHWVEINALLIPFGKHVCTGIAPRCPACPLRDVCPQIGVASPRPAGRPVPPERA